MQSINNHIMRTKWPIDMKEKALEREFHKPSIYAKTNKPDFDVCPIPPGLAMPLHICDTLENTRNKLQRPVLSYRRMSLAYGDEK